MVKLGLKITNKTANSFCFTRDIYTKLSSDNFCVLIDRDRNVIKSSSHQVNIWRIEPQLSYLVRSQETVFWSLESLFYKKLDRLRIDIRYRQE